MSIATISSLKRRARSRARRARGRGRCAAAAARPDDRRLPGGGVLQRCSSPRAGAGSRSTPARSSTCKMTVAAACPSSAWVLGVVGVHNWQLALFPEQAQVDVWGDDPSTLISSSYAPTGKITRAEGGYRVSGRWSFSSGCDHCRWVFLGGMVPPEAEGKPPEMRTFLLPRSDYRIDDTWHVAGLKATGSKDIVVEDAFVPEHRTHRMIDGYKRRARATRSTPRRSTGSRSGRSSCGASRPAPSVPRRARSTPSAPSPRSASPRATAPRSSRTSRPRWCARAPRTIDEVRLVLHRNVDARSRSPARATTCRSTSASASGTTRPTRWSSALR